MQEEEIKEYLEQVGVEYKYNCYKDKKPDACDRLADWHKTHAAGYREAARIYKQNCDTNDFGNSCFKYAQMKYGGKGLGGIKDKAEAATYWRKACDLGHKTACYNIAIYDLTSQGQARHATDKNPDEVAQGRVQRALSNLSRCCYQSDGPCCNILAMLHLHGVHGVKKDEKLALKYSEMACAHLELESCGVAADLYSRGGLGFEKEPLKAAEYKRKFDQMSEDKHSATNVKYSG